MATAVGIMDRDSWRARTDILATVDPQRRQVLSVPRDLWCDPVRNRVNVAFARGGHDLLVSCLASIGIEAQHSVCLRRLAVERALEGVTVTVPVRTPLRFWYPLAPQAPIEDGRKPVDFDPPEAELSGERLHQWMGARIARTGPSSDLHRIRRQQMLVVALLEQGFDFTSFVRDPDLVKASSPRALEELRQVDASWTFEVFDRVVPAKIDDKEVLVPAPVSDAPPA